MTDTTLDELAETYRDEGANIVGVRSQSGRIDFKDDGLPHHRSLGRRALDHGLVVVGVNPENELNEDDETAVFYERITAQTETRTVEVEEEVTVFRTENGEHAVPRSRTPERT